VKFIPWWYHWGGGKWPDFECIWKKKQSGVIEIVDMGYKRNEESRMIETFLI
jgi:hypothetical protein